MHYHGSNQMNKFMLFYPKSKHIIGDAKLHIDGLEIEQVKVQKFLEVILNSKLDWINHVCTKMCYQDHG